MTDFKPGTRVILNRDFLDTFGCYTGALPMVRGRVIEAKTAHDEHAATGEMFVLVAWDGSEHEADWFLASQLSVAGEPPQ